MYSLEEPPDTQYNQIKFWLGFLQSRIPPVEPLGKDMFKKTLTVK